MEFLLPFYLYFFPGMLPTSFQRQSDKVTVLYWLPFFTSNIRRLVREQSLGWNCRWPSFFKALWRKWLFTVNRRKKALPFNVFQNFFNKYYPIVLLCMCISCCQIRTSGDQASTEDIIEFSKLFEDEVTLDNLSRDQLKALSKLLLLPAYGSSTFLRFQLRMKLRQLEADDKVLSEHLCSNFIGCL